MTENRRLYEPCKYQFTPVELYHLGETLARETQNAYDLADAKASAMADFAASIKAADKRIADLAQKINNGYEIREIEVSVILDAPRPGVKTFARVDTGEAVREEPMTPEEMQRELFPEAKAE